MAEGFNIAAAVDYPQNIDDTTFETNKRPLEVDSNDTGSYKRPNYSGESVFYLVKITVLRRAFTFAFADRMCFRICFGVAP